MSGFVAAAGFSAPERSEQLRRVDLPDRPCTELREEVGREEELDLLDGLRRELRALLSESFAGDGREGAAGLDLGLSLSARRTTEGPCPVASCLRSSRSLSRAPARSTSS